MYTLGREASLQASCLLVAEESAEESSQAMVNA